MPASGPKTELIAFQRSTETRRPGGGLAQSISTVGEAWATATWMRGGEADRQGAVRELVIYKFTVLSAAVEELGVVATDRIVWNGETYNIRERPRRLPNRPDTEIIAETGVTQ